MSSKQMKKLIAIIVAFVIIAAGAVCLFLFVDFDSIGGEVDIEAVKASGNYEKMKADFLTTLNCRDSMGAVNADIFFEDIGIKNYESMSKGGRRGTVTVNADGYAFDCSFTAQELGNAYIGNVIVFKSTNVNTSVVANAPEYTYSQYSTLVKSFTKGLGISEEQGKKLYEQLSVMYVDSFTRIEKGKVNGMKGYFGYEGEFPYFLVLKDDKTLDKLYVVCDGFDPIEVYNSVTSKGNESVQDYKLLMGGRTTLVDGLSYQCGKAINATVVLPATLKSGDDSWLIVKHNGELYIEVKGEVVNGEKRESKQFIMRLDAGSRTIKYLKVDKKVYVGN